MQASTELNKRRKTPDQKGASSTTVLQEENFFLMEQVWKLWERLPLLTYLQERGAVRSAETSAEWWTLLGRTQ